MNHDKLLNKVLHDTYATKERLAEVEDILAQNTGQTSVSVYAGTMASVWSADIIDYAKENLVMRPLAMKDENVLEVQKGSAYYIHKITAPTMTWSTNADDDLNNSAKTTTFVTSDVTGTPAWIKGAMSISQDLLIETPESVLAAVRNTLAYELAHKIDTDIMSDVLAYINGSTAVEANITNGYIAGSGTSYVGGGSYDPASLTSADKISADDLMQTLGLVETDNMHPNALVIHPAAKTQLMQAPQFSNAAMWGDAEPVKNAQIGRFAGMDVYETTQMGQSPTTSGWGAAGRYALLIDTRKAFVHVPAVAPTIDFETELSSKNSKFYVQAKYKGAVRYDETALGALAYAD